MPELFDLHGPAAKPAEAESDAPEEVAQQPLNTEQRAAVEHGEGPLLVVAGAGTGKTRVITERIRHLLEDPELPGESILGLTFTEKAAGEMKQRVTRAAGERGAAVELATFHGFCNALLVERNPELQTLEREDHWILLRRNLAVLELERYRRLAEPGQFLGDFVEFFSRCQDELVTPEEYEGYAASLEREYARERESLEEPLEDDERRLREERIAQHQEIARAYRASDRLLRERNLLTFGMQLLDAVRAFDSDAEFAARQRGRFRYILVDEFQDTNFAQIELLWRLAGTRRNIVAVGDDAQAIYTFRGASFGSFATFLRRFAGVDPGAGRSAGGFVQPLVANYRSTGRILRVAAQVSELLERPALLSRGPLQANKPDGEKVRIAEFATAREEAQWIAGEILRLHRAGQPWGSFAALYRIGLHREWLVKALEERGIPFRIRNLSILEQPVVRDLLAYLRLLVKTSDNVACARVLAAPAWGLEAADLVRLCERARKCRAPLWEALEGGQAELPFAKTTEQGARIASLTAGVRQLQGAARRSSARETFDALAEWLELGTTLTREEQRYVQRLRQFLREWQRKSETVAKAPVFPIPARATAARAEDTGDAAQARAEAARSESLPRLSRLAEFVEYLDYFRQAGGQINLEQEGGDAVQLMTVHGAKGLEFDHVFVLRLTNSCFPSRPRRKVLEFPEALVKGEVPRGGLQIEEERRLFYVAVTRARERLTFTTVVNRYSKASPFLEDILSAPRLAREDLLQLSPKAAATVRRAAADAAPAAPATLFDAAPDSSRVHSRIGDWAREYRPPVFEPLQLSASAIDLYQKCPQKFLFRDAWGIAAGPHAATTFGNVMHTTLRQFLAAHRKGMKLPFEELEGIFRREWNSAGFEDSYQEECYRRDGLEQLRGFYERWTASPAEILALERRFTLDLENNVRVIGRIDQVNSVEGSEGEELEILDYKTGKPRTEEQAREDLQMNVYALAAEEEFGKRPARLVYYNLQTNECAAAERDEECAREVIAEIQETAGDIRARHFPAKPDSQCKTCDFLLLCPAKEQRRESPEAGEAP